MGYMMIPFFFSIIYAPLLCLFISATIYCAPYTLCIDGGGSKTLLQVIDTDGKLIALKKNNHTTELIEAAASNPNTVGAKGVKEAFDFLIQGTRIAKTDELLSTLLPTCRVIAGMAGAANPDNRELLLTMMEDYGLGRDRITLMNDGALALELVGQRGIVLISGTGSICFAKNNGITRQVGGLGPILGDEGSGHHIGLEALKKGIAQELGYGKITRLTDNLKEFYHVDTLQLLIGPICRGEIKPATIAAAAPIVFETAFLQHDPVAEDLVREEIAQLIFHITKACEIADLVNCDLFLFGGTFKNLYADNIIEAIDRDPRIESRGLRIVNHAFSNAALIYARNKQKSM